MDDPKKANLPENAHIEVAAGSLTTETGIDDLPVCMFVGLVAFTASIAGMLFGYDTGIISAVLVYIHDGLDHRTLTSNEKELITSLCSGGALFGSILAGLTADKLGRKSAIYFGCALFTIGAVLQGAAYTIAQMAVGRIIVGFGGQVISYAIEAAFANVSHGWRYMVGLGALPALILAALMPFCPESPRHLLYNHRQEEARAVLRRIYGHPYDVQLASVLASISAACDEAREINEGATRWTKIKQLHTVPSNFRALISACGLMVISQLSGFNTLMYYSSTLFALVGFDNPTAVGIVVAGTNFIMTWVNMMVIDKMGRRRLLLSTAWGMSVGLIAIAVAFSFIPVDLDTLDLKSNSVSPPAIVVLVFIIWFVIFYGVSVGHTAWMSTDIFPLEITCSSWGSNVIVSSAFLSMMKSIPPSGAFGFYAGICGVGYVLIYFFYPEVSGLSLEETKEVFKHEFVVRYARNLRKERKDIIRERLRIQGKTAVVGH
ncbi:MFS sugar transporter [Aspergillus arachidicola]|uniref:MFS sugar transporter n=1 Tax=Aspergillus arachidicola TaxID=656916 RepID=A0A2G7FJD5_9EURO|nr:MFS sugar transporter [Aspergillus arachidicola]